MSGCGFNGDPSESAQVGDSDGAANFTFFHNGFDNVKLAVNRLKEIKTTYCRKGKERSCVGKRHESFLKERDFTTEISLALIQETGTLFHRLHEERDSVLPRPFCS